jgi:hypothetical protein
VWWLCQEGGSLNVSINITDYVVSDVIQVTESQIGKCVKEAHMPILRHIHGVTKENKKEYSWSTSVSVVELRTYRKKQN